MKYALLFNSEGGESPDEAEAAAAVMSEVDQWWGRYSQAGAILGGERLQPASRATTVRFGGQSPTIVDGPFAETKEAIGGFAIVEVPDLDAALEMVKTWPASSSVEIRPIWED
jgi:hypothetical protein